jgi:hypothetical protein
MSVFQVDPSTNELVREGGAFKRTKGLDEIRQDHQVGLQVLRGEIPMDLTLGFPWVDNPFTGDIGLLGKNTPPEILGSRVRNRIESRAGTVEVLSLEVIDEGDRRVSIPYQARVSVDQLRRALLVNQTVSVG